ncbi:hypothetical protein [Maricaulis maris]|uniref:hypothetical protein n=1 Tax=Maricaulis maris TaxID=74318 RepID=UPI003B8DCB96
MALKGFNVMLQAEDAVGECFVSYGVIAADADAAARLAEGAAQSEGFWSLALEDVWEPEPEEGDDPLGDIPEVLGRTEPTYLDEDDYDEGD